MVCCAQALSLGKTLSHWFSRASSSENKISRWEEEKRARASEVTQKKLFGKEKTWEKAVAFNPATAAHAQMSRRRVLSLRYSPFARYLDHLCGVSETSRRGGASGTSPNLKSP